MLSEFKYGGPVMQAIINRRSQFHFTDIPVSKNSIDMLLNAGMRTSTISSNRLWSYVVIQDGAYIAYLREYALLLKQLNDTSGLNERNVKLEKDFHMGSESLILICTNLLSPFALDDCWLAVENMLLTGSALGFGVLMDGSLLKVANLSNIKNDLNVPDELTVTAAIIVGEPENPLLPSNGGSPKIWKWVCSS
jgi:nitroreductase